MLEATPEQLEQFKAAFSIYEASMGTENAEYRKEAAELIKAIQENHSNIRARSHKFAKDANKLKNKNKTNRSKKLKDIPDFEAVNASFKTDIRSATKDIKNIRKQLNELKVKYGMSTKTGRECWQEAYKLDMEYLRNKAN